MKCRKGKDETMKIAWVHKLLGKHSKKFYGILAGILTAAVAGSGVGYHVIAASGTADQTEEDTQIDETDGQEDGSFSGTGTTQVKTESQLPDFSVNAVTMTVEEVYVEAGSTVAEGDALFKIDDESMADAKAYYEDAISDAKTALQSAQINFESGVLEAKSELSSTKLAADTAQDTYDAAVSELSVKTSEAQEAYDEAVEEISDYQDAIDNGTYYTQVGINEKQAAVDTAQATLTEKQTQLSNAQSSSQAAKETYAADMANLKTQIEAGASYTDLAALADQLAADYTAVQEAADALSQSQTEAESANSALQLANQTFQKAVEEYNTKVTEANEKIAELTDELEKLSDACDEAERNETTAQPALLQQYEEAVLEGKYADTEYEASLETLQSAVDEAQDTLDELKEQQSALLAIEDGVVCADRDGTLASVTYEAGDTLIKNTAFASYYDLDTILISVEVSQNNIAKLAVGDTVQVQINKFADLDAGTAQADHDIREICLEEQADQRVDDVIHQSRDDGRERTADDHADCHIQHIAAHGKGLEFLKEFLDPLDLFFWHKTTAPFQFLPVRAGNFLCLYHTGFAGCVVYSSRSNPSFSATN